MALHVFEGLRYVNLWKRGAINFKPKPETNQGNTEGHIIVGFCVIL